jgi:DNA repair protein RadC
MERLVYTITWGKERGSLMYINRVRVSVVKEPAYSGSGALTCPGDIVTLLSDLKTSDREQFLTIHLDNKNNIISIEVTSVGTNNLSLVHPREIFRAAVLQGANAIVVVHNHPSGDPAPSPEDLAVTLRLVEAGNILGIPLLDHIIMGDDTYYAFSEKVPSYLTKK